MSDHRRKTYYGRSNRPGNHTGLLAVLAVILLVLAGVLLAGAFVPSVKQKAVEIAGKLSEGELAQAVLSGFYGGEPETESTVPEASTRFSATEAAEETGVQSITVIRETEAPTETEAPPKYTENENTKLIASAKTDAETSPDAAVPEQSPDITLTFAGDILFDSHYAIMASLLQRSGGTPKVENAFGEALLAKMREADVFMVNNEFPYSNQGTPLEGKQYTFRADPAYASLLTDMGADIVSLANNHMYDHGEIALLDTLDTLSSMGMPYVGAGRNLSEAASPYYFTNGQVKIGFVSATQIERLGNPDTKGATETSAGVFRCMNSENLLKVIADMKEECDFIVAYLHWGTESTEKSDEWQRKLAVEVVEAGADLIIGDHPHVLQGISVYEGVPIVYSLGNFLFNSGAQDTCLVTASIDPVTAELKSLQFVPARQEGCRTRLLENEEKERVLTYMRSISKAEFDADGFVDLTGKE